MHNVLHRFDLASFSMQFFALKTINPGDQIFYNYCYVGERDLLIKRRATLSRYGIVCTCYACTNSSPESEALRSEFPNRIRNLSKACDDLIGGGLIVVGPDGKLPRHLSPDKPFNEAIQGGKLRKEILGPALRLLSDLEKEGLDTAMQMYALWAVLGTAWRRLSGPFAAMKSQEAYKQLWNVLDVHDVS